MEDDPRTFRVSGPLPSLGEWPAPVPANPPVSTPRTRKQFLSRTRKQFLWGVVVGLLPMLFFLAGLAGRMIFLASLAEGVFILNLTFGVGLALSRANRWYGIGLLIGCFSCAIPFCVAL